MEGDQVIEEDEEDVGGPTDQHAALETVSLHGYINFRSASTRETFEPEFDTSKLASELTPGRLSIRCIAEVSMCGGRTR